MPPSASCRRTATSASFVPRTSSAARCWGDLPASTFCDQRIVRACPSAPGTCPASRPAWRFPDRHRSALRRTALCLSDSRFDSRYSRSRSALGLARFLGQANQRAGDLEQLAVERRAPFEQVVVVVNRRQDDQRFVDRLQGRRRSRGSFGSSRRRPGGRPLPRPACGPSRPGLAGRPVRRAVPCGSSDSPTAVLGPPGVLGAPLAERPNSTSRRRSRSSVAGRRQSRRNSRCRTVFSRSVWPGFPATNTRSSSFSPAGFHADNAGP